MRDDCSDVVERCRGLLQDSELRTGIQERAFTFFDRNFSPQSIARRILHQPLR
jgi:hypothetical protein